MYEDDTHLTFANNNVVHQEWLTANNLTLNKSKTEFMLIGSKAKVK